MYMYCSDKMDAVEMMKPLLQEPARLETDGSPGGGRASHHCCLSMVCLYKG